MNETHTLDLMYEALTATQWGELLKTPLKRAAVKGKRDLLQKLVKAGAKIGDALHKTVQGGHEEIVNDLLESGASIDVKGMEGNTPLRVAAAVVRRRWCSCCAQGR